MSHETDYSNKTGSHDERDPSAKWRDLDKNTPDSSLDQAPAFDPNYDPGVDTGSDTYSIPRPASGVSEDKPSDNEVLQTPRKKRRGLLAAVGAAAAVAVLGTGLAISRDANADAEITFNDTDKVTEETIDQMPSDELVTESVEPEPTAPEFPSPYPELTVETAEISLEGITTREDVAPAVVDFINKWSRAGITEDNYTEWEQSNLPLDEYLGNLADTNMQIAVEGLFDTDSEHSNSVEFAQSIRDINYGNLMEAYGARRDNHTIPDNQFVFESIENADNLDKPPVLQSTITIVRESNDENDGKVYEFNTNGWSLNSEGDILYFPLDSDAEGTLHLDGTSALVEVEHTSS